MDLTVPGGGSSEAAGAVDGAGFWLTAERREAGLMKRTLDYPDGER